ncbi:hypothetical protein QAD02_005729 [Eretmocerus hayati]|uniref:Uncharacterized protein n=1 Tax=Eretmocerus hayati TaxID=131215 RepID=A0ACC2NTM7_9HYME|nr:hypothetical protein QAD02_005729 [Eretmocerus hayati]
MALASLAKGHISPPHRWSTATLDEILSKGNSAYGLMKFRNQYYFTDSHSCDITGQSTSNGRACVIQCDTIQILLEFCNSKFGDCNVIYNLHYVDISAEVDVVHEEYPLPAALPNVEPSTTPQLSRTPPMSNHPALKSTEPVPESIHMHTPDSQIQTHHHALTSDIPNYESQRSLHHSAPLTMSNPPNPPVLVGLDFNVPRDMMNSSPNVPEQQVACNETLPIQTSVMLTNDQRQPNDKDAFEISDQTNKITRKTRDNIVNNDHEIYAEEFAWFQLFPYGNNGLNEPARTVRITLLDYFQFRILGKDNRFQRNDYLFYALSTYEYHRVKSTIAACGKRVRGPEGVVEDLHLYMQNLRGSAAMFARHFVVHVYALMKRIRNDDSIFDAKLVDH